MTLKECYDAGYTKIRWPDKSWEGSYALLQDGYYYYIDPHGVRSDVRWHHTEIPYSGNEWIPVVAPMIHCLCPL